jgi:hypothetical protein
MLHQLVAHTCVRRAATPLRCARDIAMQLYAAVPSSSPQTAACRQMAVLESWYSHAGMECKGRRLRHERPHCSSSRSVCAVSVTGRTGRVCVLQQRVQRNGHEQNRSSVLYSCLQQKLGLLCSPSVAKHLSQVPKSCRIVLLTSCLTLALTSLCRLSTATQPQLNVH